MSEAGQLAEEAAREAGVPFDRRKYDHDEVLLVVRENSKHLADQISDLRSEVRNLEAKLNTQSTTLSYVLWISFLLLSAAVVSQMGLFK
jgi:hypothetical protein